MTRTIPMRNGIFLAPFHSLDQDPTEALHRDLELLENLDRLGYEEAWIGEHHSAGFEIIASPEVFIAAAAERTRNIRLGTGVVSLPYHNPLMTANRIIQLDHQTRGRVMLGVGPGLLPSDAMMLGIDPMIQRERMMAGLKVIMRLFNGEVVTEKSEWYNLVNARAHLLPYTKPHPEIAVASAVSPSGGRAAGKYGLGMLCVAATNAYGFDALATNWQVANEIAAENGRTMDRSRLRLVGPVHLAESRDQARKNVEYGIRQWLEYFNRLNPLAPKSTTGKDQIDDMIDSGAAVIGTPADAIAQLQRLEAKQGEFGAFLQLAHNWASFENTIKSYDLWAEHVAPVFKNANVSRQASYDWTMSNAHDFMGQAMNAAAAMTQKHAAERAAKKQANGENASVARAASK
jgi:limonene 1,2-monooxygenase